jgi:hypothetical protein
VPRRRPLVAAVSLALAAPLCLLTAPAHAATPVKPYDFNGDGYPELAVAADGLTVGSYLEAGGVFVYPASRSGLSSRTQVVTAASPGVVGTPHHAEHFGSGLASGDFDGDGFADLAIGRYGAAEFGAVTVVYGSAKGLTGTRSQELVQPATIHTEGAFGSAMVAGDLDGDGRADLAVGMGGIREFSGQQVGKVVLFRSAAAGLSQDRSSLLQGVPGPPVAGLGPDTDFGSTLAVADLDSDGRLDLVVGGNSSYRQGGVPTGFVDACYGVAGGPTTCDRLIDDPALWGTRFRSMVVGNFSGTKRPEIIVGILANNGVNSTLQVLSLSGPRASTTVSHTELSEDSPGVPGAVADHGSFGADLALGDLDHDGFDDLVAGAPSGGGSSSGRVVLVYGDAAGYRTTGAETYAQGQDGVPGKAEADDNFGTSLSVVDHDRDGHPDLTVGAPGENGKIGAITIIDGSGTGFTTQGSRTMGLGSLKYPTNTDDAVFGSLLGH